MEGALLGRYSSSGDGQTCDMGHNQDIHARCPAEGDETRIVHGGEVHARLCRAAAADRLRLVLHSRLTVAHCLTRVPSPRRFRASSRPVEQPCQSLHSCPLPVQHTHRNHFRTHVALSRPPVPTTTTQRSPARPPPILWRRRSCAALSAVFARPPNPPQPPARLQCDSHIRHSLPPPPFAPISRASRTRASAAGGPPLHFLFGPIQRRLRHPFTRPRTQLRQRPHLSQACTYPGPLVDTTHSTHNRRCLSTGLANEARGLRTAAGPARALKGCSIRTRLCQAS